MCCSSCIIYMPLLAFLCINTIGTCSFYILIINIIMNCASIAFAQRVVQRCQRPPLCSTLSLTLCHCVSILCIFVPLCFNPVYFCATVFEIYVFFTPLCFRSVYLLLCHRVLDLFYYTRSDLISTESNFTSNPALFQILWCFPPKKFNIETFIKVTIWNNSFCLIQVYKSTHYNSNYSSFYDNQFRAAKCFFQVE